MCYIKVFLLGYTQMVQNMLVGIEVCIGVDYSENKGSFNNLIKKFIQV